LFQSNLAIAFYRSLSNLLKITFQERKVILSNILNQDKKKACGARRAAL